MTAPRLEDFASRTYDKLRFGDMDRQGHVNNAVFATLFETGRVHIFHQSGTPMLAAGFAFVLARIAIDYRTELFWPGRVEIGTSVAVVGNSAVTFAQALFQDTRLVAEAQSVVVQVDVLTRKPMRLSEPARERLAGLMAA